MGGGGIPPTGHRQGVAGEGSSAGTRSTPAAPRPSWTPVETAEAVAVARAAGREGLSAGERGARPWGVGGQTHRGVIAGKRPAAVQPRRLHAGRRRGGEEGGRCLGSALPSQRGLDAGRGTGRLGAQGAGPVARVCQLPLRTAACTFVSREPWPRGPSHGAHSQASPATADGQPRVERPSRPAPLTPDADS